MTAPLTGFDPDNFPLDVIYESGVVMIAAVPVGVVVGGVKWNNGKTYTQPGFDGKQADYAGLDRPMYGAATLSFVMQELGDATTGNQIHFLEPGATSASAGTPSVETITPKPGGGFVAAGDYSSNVRMLCERGSQGSGNYVAVLLEKALCTKYDVSTQPGKEGQVTVEFTARLPLTAPINQAPYKFEYRTDVPAA